MKRQTALWLRLALLAATLAVGVHVLPGKGAVLVGLAAAAAAAWKLGVSRLLVATALVGLPFVAGVAALIGISPTTLVMALDVILALMVLRSAGALLHDPGLKGLRLFMIWWPSFLLLYSVYVLAGDRSEYAVFAWQYLAVYGSYYALAALLAVKERMPLADILVIGVLAFSFQYWILDIPIWSVASIADYKIGLRGSEGFNPIDGARTAGLLLVMAMSVYLVDRKRLRLLPEIALGIALAAPLAWYAFTRQVYVAVGLVVALMVLVTLFSRGATQGRGGRLFVFVSLCAGIAVAAREVVRLMANASHSRVAEQGLELDRLGIWMRCLDMIADNPLTGIGVGGFQRTGIGLWPHNWFIEAWLELGILGLLLTAAGAAAIVAGLFRHAEDWLKGWGFLGIYFLLVAQVSGDIARNAPMIFFVALAMHAALSGNEMRRRGNAAATERTRPRWTVLAER